MAGIADEDLSGSGSPQVRRRRGCRRERWARTGRGTNRRGRHAPPRRDFCRPRCPRPSSSPPQKIHSIPAPPRRPVAPRRAGAGPGPMRQPAPARSVAASLGSLRWTANGRRPQHRLRPWPSSRRRFRSATLAGAGAAWPPFRASHVTLSASEPPTGPRGWLPQATRKRSISLAD